MKIKEKQPRKTVVVCFLLAVAGIPLSAALATPPEPKPEEHWYVVNLQGQKCGYMHSTIKPVGDEVHTASTMKFAIRRGEIGVEITVEQRQRETLDGRPLAFRQTMLMGEQPMTTEGEIKDGKIHLTQNNMGAVFKHEFDFDPDIKFAWGMQLEQLKHGLAPGTSFTLKSYDPSVNLKEPFEITLKVDGKEKVELPDGTKRELTKITSTMQLGAPIESESWVDDDGLPLMMDFQMGAFSLRVLHATEQQALEGGEAPELFLNTFIPVAKTIKPDARKITYRLRIPEGKGGRLPDLPETAMQKIKRVSDREVLLTVQRLDWDALRKIKKNTFDEAIGKEYLKASSMLDANDARIKRLAKRAIKGQDTPAAMADALRQRITEFVKDKGLDVGFATASEVVRNKKGDCTEHGVLLAAVARAAGLPSRGVSGIVKVPEGALSPEKGCLFGYHMWTQVYIAGQWVDIDAALRQTDCDATHIALALMPLNDEGMAGSVVAILPLLGQVEMEVLDAE